MSEAAYTRPGHSYPPFINLKEDGHELVLTIRSNPEEKDGLHICGQTCLPAGPNCNNYCNLAASKGPMADRPMSRKYIKEGQTASVRFTRDEMREFLTRAQDLVAGVKP